MALLITDLFSWRLSDLGYRSTSLRFIFFDILKNQSVFDIIKKKTKRLWYLKIYLLKIMRLNPRKSIVRFLLEKSKKSQLALGWNFLIRNNPQLIELSKILEIGLSLRWLIWWTKFEFYIFLFLELCDSFFTILGRFWFLFNVFKPVSNLLTDK